MPSKAERRAAEEAAAKEAQARFAEELPKKLLMAMAWAHKLGVESRVESSNDVFFCVLFRFPERKGRYTQLHCTDETVSLGNQSSEWEFNMLLSTLQEHETFATEETKALETARAGYDALTAEQRAALGLHRRP